MNMNTKSVLTRVIPGLFLPVIIVACGGSGPGYDATGTFEATEIIVSSEVTGRILMLEAGEGERLEAGVTVGLVDTVQLFLKRRQLEATLVAIASRRADIPEQVAATRQQLATARAERDRFRSLVERDAASRKQVDDIDAQVAVLERQLAAQTTTLEERNRGVAAEFAAVEAQVAQLDDQLLRCRVASPVAGTVLVKYAEAGEVVSAGKPLFKVADMDHVFLRAYVTADRLSRVRLGQEARVFAEDDAGGHRVYTGRVTWIADKAEFTPKSVQTRDERANQVYAVKIAARNDGWIRVGMYGEVIFGE
jgi:HlyD family secretion protein